ncbi:class I SAM-dependent methyltransferase [Streptomyces sp. NPDC058470]|uniref:class I SAM-dependent methyltransferase n=1 Tax=Streptomyces sp. NPDC058470 TaxID=3346515 RepID=UPI0036526540
MDASPGMIAEARRVHPAMSFAVLDTPPTPAWPDESVDTVLLFAVLTCIPGDDAQTRPIGELRRVLKPGGLLYLSDLLLQDDQHNRDRCAGFAEHHDTYGVFRTDDGAVCRHHSRDRLSSLLAGFDSRGTRYITVPTMNGHESVAIQILARKPTPHHHAPTH